MQWKVSAQAPRGARLRQVAAGVLGLVFCLALAIGGTAAAERRGSLLHDYDAVTDAVVAWRLNPGERISQSFVVPAGVESISGFRLRLSRFGRPGPARYRLGSRWDGSDLAAGTLETGPVNPWFERWYTLAFDAPCSVKPGDTYYLRLELPEAAAEGYLDVYGTAAARIDDERFRPRFQYTQIWYPTEEDSRVFENSANLDYGLSTPVYEGGSAFDRSGKPLPAMDLALDILETASPSDHSGDDSCEERFAFTEEITGPLYVRSLRNPKAQLRAGEFSLSGWTVVYPSRLENVTAAALAGFDSFMSVAMEEELGTRQVERLLPGKQNILLGLREDFPDLQSEVDKPESFRLEATPHGVRICGFDERGIMRGLYFLESQMRLRRAPFLVPLSEVRRPRHSPRITAAPFFALSEMEVPEDPYTDGLLARISRAGFNAIWLWGYLDEVAASSVYPELDPHHDVVRRQEKLHQLIARARPFGIDVYMYLATRPLPEVFFQRHPNVRGSDLPAHGGTHVLCTSVPEVREHVTVTTRNLMASVPGLKGIVFIIGGEGFVHCYTRTNTCSRCVQRSPQETIAELSEAVLRGVKSGNPEAKAVLWPYSASNQWSQDDTTQSKLIERLPQELVFMSEFSKEGLITFGGVTAPAYDYAISYVGPSQRIVRQRDLVRQRGLEFWIKSEHAIALEFVQTPYIPVFWQWAERYDRLLKMDGVTAVFGNWMHYGFMPTLAAELHSHYIWENPPDRLEVLRGLAGSHFGEGTEEQVVEAWRLFSEAIREYPFSGAMALGVIQKGPSHPLFLDPKYVPVHGAGRQFRNDLNWTAPWGPELAHAQLCKMEQGWKAGLALLEEVAEHTPPELQSDARRELGVARALHHCMLTAIHLIEFYQARDRLLGNKRSEAPTALLAELASIARRELENARHALPVVQADSRLGFANSGGSMQTGVPRAGIYSPGAIEKKIRQVERLLEVELPELGRRLGAGG